MRAVYSEADVRITAPAQTIVPVVRAVRHLKPLETLDLARIDELLHTVDDRLEQALGCAVLRSTWRATFTPGSARVLRLREGPIVSVDEILAFDDEAETDQDGDVVPTTSYRVLTHRSPAEVHLRDEASWPVTLRDEASVTVTYTTGWATVLDVPADIRHAGLLLAAHLFEHPTATSLPSTVEALLAPHSQRRRCAA